MAKLTKRKRSIVERKYFLERVCISIANHVEDSDLLSALSSQGAFARYENNDFVSMSLNSMKKHADEMLEGGFNLLDSLRKKTFYRLKKFSDSETKINKPDTRQVLIGQLKASREEAAVLQSELMVATLCLKQFVHSQEALIEQIGDDALRKRFNKERQQILSLFSHGIESDVALAQFQNVILFKDAL